MSVHSVRITIDRQEREITPGLVMGSALLGIVSLSGHEQLLLEVKDDIDIPVAPSDGILLRGGEAFSIGKGVPPIEDNPPLKHAIRIHLGGDLVAVEQGFHHAKVTGAQIKALDPNLQPGDVLYADLDGLADELIHDTLRIILQKHDRFIVVPCGNVGGEDLVLRDLAEVQALFPRAHLAEEGVNRYLVVPDFRLPDHWSVPAVTLLAMVPNGYPMAAMDMFWVDPILKLRDGREPGAANSFEVYLGKQWQRFSWHYSNPQVAWRPGQSTLLTHLRFCQVRLANAG